MEQIHASDNQPNNGFSQQPFEGASKRNTMVGRCKKTHLRLKNRAIFPILAFQLHPATKLHPGIHPVGAETCRCKYSGNSPTRRNCLKQLPKSKQSDYFRPSLIKKIVKLIKVSKETSLRLVLWLSEQRKHLVRGLTQQPHSLRTLL